MKKVLITFPHGLGDTVQFSNVLRHLAIERPGWKITLDVGRGKASAIAHLVDELHTLEEGTLRPDGFDEHYNLSWPECHSTYHDSPSTKVERTLREHFQIQPSPEMTGYDIKFGDERQVARDYLAEITEGMPQPDDDGPFPTLLFHYEGNTSSDYKNLSHLAARGIIELAKAYGLRPVLLDWDRRSPHAERPLVACPDVDCPLWKAYGTGDAATLAALIDSSTAVVAIDSGPQKIAAATQTPTLAVWRTHHPVHYIAPAENVVNLVPYDHARHIRGDRNRGLAYFDAHYHHVDYYVLRVGLKTALSKMLESLTGPGKRHPDGRHDVPRPTRKNHVDRFTRRTDFRQVGDIVIRPEFEAEDLVIVDDILDQDSYQLNTMNLDDADLIIDVGAHIGAFTTAARRRAPKATIVAAEVNPSNIPTLQINAHGDENIHVVEGAVMGKKTKPLKLWDTVHAAGKSTGGSFVSNADAPTPAGVEYRDGGLVNVVTLDDLIAEYAYTTKTGPLVHLLKLDCEGAEFDILHHCKNLNRIAVIVGEYHSNLVRWHHLLWEKFIGGGKWIHESHETGTDIGLFRLTNKAYL